MAEPMKAAGIKSAQIYGVVMVAGMAVLPVAVVATFIGKDSVQQSIDAAFERVYEVSLDVLKRMGKVTEQDALKGTIQANINGADVALKLKRAGSRTELTISARKYMFPKLDIAGGVLYQISEKL
jgi:molecular chaperone DnaK (HSP70)